jgi:hypothetical protein
MGISRDDGGGKVGTKPTRQDLGLLQEFKQQWTFEGICVADAAYTSEET